MTQAAIDHLIGDLARLKSTGTLFNPFADARLANNLRLYFNFLLEAPVRVAMIGEAAGHRGCAHTGMPFTSPETLRDCQNAFFSAHRDRLYRQGDIYEPSGRWVWGVADAHGVVPLLWNALPLHPHEPGKVRTNRTPTRTEMELGQPFLVRVLDIFRPELVVAVGRKAEQSLNTLFPDLAFTTVRHPSMGGSTLFKEQMGDILRALPR
jgi:uracil-DNA glycosylase